MPKYRLIGGTHRVGTGKPGTDKVKTYRAGEIIEMDVADAMKFKNKFELVDENAAKAEAPDPKSLPAGGQTGSDKVLGDGSGLQDVPTGDGGKGDDRGGRRR